MTPFNKKKESNQEDLPTLTQELSSVSPSKSIETLQKVTIRMAGDSGDGMQLAGSKFTTESVILGNDVSTLPDFPAEIRAPQGTLAGVSGFQIQFGSSDIYTPGMIATSFSMQHTSI